MSVRLDPLSVPCPHCQSPANKRCVSTGHRRRPTRLHKKRQRAAADAFDAAVLDRCVQVLGARRHLLDTSPSDRSWSQSLCGVPYSDESLVLEVERVDCPACLRARIRELEANARLVAQ